MRGIVGLLMRIRVASCPAVSRPSKPSRRRRSSGFQRPDRCSVVNCIPRVGIPKLLNLIFFRHPGKIDVARSRRHATEQVSMSAYVEGNFREYTAHSLKCKISTNRGSTVKSYGPEKYNKIIIRCIKQSPQSDGGPEPAYRRLDDIFIFNSYQLVPILACFILILVHECTTGFAATKPLAWGRCKRQWSGTAMM